MSEMIQYRPGSPAGPSGGEGERNQTGLSAVYSPAWGELNHQISVAVQREELDFENRSASFRYPRLDYTISEGDLLAPSS